MLKLKFSKFLMSSLNWRFNSSSNFASFFMVMTRNSSVNFQLMHFLLWIKGPHKSPNWETFECSGENLPNPSCHLRKRKSVFLQILYQFSVPSNITPLYFLTSKIIYFKSNPLKCKCLRLSSAKVKILKTPYVGFETASQFLVRFFVILHCHYTFFVSTFLAHAFSTLDKMI